LSRSFVSKNSLRFKEFTIKIDIMMVTRFGIDRSNRGAALLLLEVRMIAIDEVREGSPSPPSSPLTTRHTCNLISESSENSFSSDGRSNPITEDVTTPRKLRCRAVSVCSQDTPSLIQDTFVVPVEPEPSFIVGSEHEEDSVRSDRIPSESTLKTPTSASPFPFNPSKKFVGGEVEGTIKAKLRKKFSWKSYPELEAYLVDNRNQYMQYSSQLNYTAEQKRYNNTLTQGLLELAAREGYCFEGFTFAAIRDRIRCYYKSYVQASKKRKRRKSK
jgi:hypothetical protein